MSDSLTATTTRCPQPRRLCPRLRRHRGAGEGVAEPDGGADPVPLPRRSARCTTASSSRRWCSSSPGPAASGSPAEGDWHFGLIIPFVYLAELVDAWRTASYLGNRPRPRSSSRIGWSRPPGDRPRALGACCSSQPRLAAAVVARPLLAAAPHRAPAWCSSGAPWSATRADAYARVPRGAGGLRLLPHRPRRRRTCCATSGRPGVLDTLRRFWPVSLVFWGVLDLVNVRLIRSARGDA